MLTTALIPTAGVWITETRYPAGWQVANYDAQGFASEIRWFACRDKAERYARALQPDTVDIALRRKLDSMGR